MHGNVAEWVTGCHYDYEDAPTDGSAWTIFCSDARGNVRSVLRGGSWFNNPRDLRAAFRYRYRNAESSLRYRTTLLFSRVISDMGFRLVQDLNP